VRLTVVGSSTLSHASAGGQSRKWPGRLDTSSSESLMWPSKKAVCIAVIGSRVTSAVYLASLEQLSYVK